MTRQVAPPSLVRSTVPRVPLAQATRSVMTLRPRRLAVVPEDWSCHCARSSAGWNVAADSAIAAIEMDRRGMTP
jgi:hypothetical protein